MGYIKRKRYFQLFIYGWKDAVEISHKNDVNKSCLFIYWDIISCFRKHYIFSNQYKDYKVWEMPESDRIVLGETIGSSNQRRDKWIDRHYQDKVIINKFHGQVSPKRAEKRLKAFRKHFNLNEDTLVQDGVVFNCEHGRIGNIVAGKKVLIICGVIIDYTGDITIGNGVSIAENTIIFTHGHTYIGNRKDFYEYSSRTYLSPLTIEDNVFIGAHCIIMPGVGTIGENSLISAGSVVTRPVPPNSLVEGNPAKVKGTISPKMRTFYRYSKE